MRNTPMTMGACQDMYWAQMGCKRLLSKQKQANKELQENRITSKQRRHLRPSDWMEGEQLQRPTNQLQADAFVAHLYRGRD